MKKRPGLAHFFKKIAIITFNRGNVGLTNILKLEKGFVRCLHKNGISHVKI